MADWHFSHLPRFSLATHPPPTHPPSPVWRRQAQTQLLLLLLSLAALVRPTRRHRHHRPRRAPSGKVERFEQLTALIIIVAIYGTDYNVFMLPWDDAVERSVLLPTRNLLVSSALKFPADFKGLSAMRWMTGFKFRRIDVSKNKVIKDDKMNTFREPFEVGCNQFALSYQNLNITLTEQSVSKAKPYEKIGKPNLNLERKHSRNIWSPEDHSQSL